MTRVLVVDDDEDLARMLARALRCEDFEVRVAHDANEAMQLLPGFDPHVTLLDLHLPDDDGHALGLRLRAESSRALQVVILTGDDSHAAQVRSESAGFAGHLIKPIPLGELTDMVALACTRALR